MRDWDTAYYGRLFNAACRDDGVPEIKYPEGEEYAVWVLNGGLIH